MKLFLSLEDFVVDSFSRAYYHLVKKAWLDLDLSAVISINNIPTVFIKASTTKLSEEQRVKDQKLFWNQGLAKILISTDSENVHIYSGLVKPHDPSKENSPESLIEVLELVKYTQNLQHFYLSLSTGQFYREHNAKFNSQEGVDSYLLENLSAIRDALTTGQDQMPVKSAHTFLARILFTSYLIDRAIIDLSHYDFLDCQSNSSLLDMLLRYSPEEAIEKIHLLFDQLKSKFNGSMFSLLTQDEKNCIQSKHIELLITFLQGDEVKKKQRTLGFWAYDFSWISVETISSIYEDFLAYESQETRHKSGAYYTPHLLAETTLDIALQNDPEWMNKSYIDPACGSGMFLVAMFHRLSAEWLIKNPNSTYEKKAQAILEILTTQLCGVDINLTACKITCFSLYLAFLDAFDPPGIFQYIDKMKKKLPNILQVQESPSAEHVVVIEGNSLSKETLEDKKFDYVIGNPPWAGRGTKQIAHDFTVNIPNILKQNGTSCFILPSKVLFNKTDKFQLEVLEKLKIDKVLLLADYRRILFENAICPSVIIRFEHKDCHLSYKINYEVPKVQNLDSRSGVIPISPQDRKQIPVEQVIESAEKGLAALVWKEYFWGTPADLKLIDYLKTFSSLGDLTGSPSEDKRWIKGQGFIPEKEWTNKQNLKEVNWLLDEPFVSPQDLSNKFIVNQYDCISLESRLSDNEYLLDKAYRCPAEKVFEPPLILVNQGFSVCSFFDYKVRFQDSLQSISGPKEDSNILLFLSVYLKSKLAKYFLFHTSANWGLERDKVHLFELMRLPFMLPEHEDSVHNSNEIVHTVVHKVKAFHQSLSDFKLNAKSEKEKAEELQCELDQYFYQYFDLSEQEIFLIEDTLAVNIPSSTPASANSIIPSTQSIVNNSLKLYKDGLKPYAETISSLLNEWSELSGDSTKVQIEAGVDSKTNLSVVSLKFSEDDCCFKEVKIESKLSQILKEIQSSSTQNSGTIDYLKGLFIYHPEEILIVKSADLVNWTRSAAINDAAQIYAEIVAYRKGRSFEYR